MKQVLLKASIRWRNFGLQTDCAVPDSTLVLAYLCLEIKQVVR
jgi:hypothetical protein